MTLDSVPKILSINEQYYVITGAVSYDNIDKYASDKNNGHYIVYIYDTTRWYLYDN